MYSSENASTLPHSALNGLIITLHGNKFHGCDEILIGMIKICDQSIFKPLSIVYEDCLNTGNIPDIWKKNQKLFLSITKMKNKLSITSGQYLFCLYREKILERLVCNSFLTFVIITVYLVQTNQVLELLIDVKTNFCQFVIKCMTFLIVIQLSRSEVYFEIYLKHLAESGVKC